MASRGWGGSVAVALGVAAATAAAALGLGYGLGIVSWPTVTDGSQDSAWLASLAWTAWIAAAATVIGAVVADRLSAGESGGAPPRRSAAERDGVYRSSAPGAVATTAWRLVIALTAAIGGLLTVPLVAVPARAAHRPDTYAPQLIAGGYAIVGVIVGLLVAILALSSRAVALNVILGAGWIWALAIASVIHGVATGQGLSTAQLAVWRFGGHFINGTISLPGAGLMLGSSLAVGVLAAWPALRRGDNRVGVAISGAAGPVLVAAAYFLAAPKIATVRADQHFSAFLLAPYAVLAGLAGSVVLTALVTDRERRATTAATASTPPRQPSKSTVDSLADDAYASERAYADE
ncbi:MAG TPA: hypothetical protein VJT31_23980 [Rugosimonospora sp.]|nr:hypothetical protein [Rugosimonospora sp.]